MKLPIFQVDAFANNVFSGNPAAVVPLKEWLPTEIMQNIAAENNLSETAFFIPFDEGFHLRWFTPATEVNLCGHATLATSHVLFNHLNYMDTEIIFHSKSGKFTVNRKNEHIELDFPSSPVHNTALREDAVKMLGVTPMKCFTGSEDIMFVFQSEEEIRNIRPDFALMKTIETRGIIATARSAHYDFISRFFAPAEGIDEDPVTGSAHTMLVPYWSEILGRKKLVARQISKRGGTLFCTNLDNRVLIAGKAITYLTGEIII